MWSVLILVLYIIINNIIKPAVQMFFSESVVTSSNSIITNNTDSNITIITHGLWDTLKGPAIPAIATE